MTEFEQEVADALRVLLVAHMGTSPDPEDWDSVGAGIEADYLAPRVAAAIASVADTDSSGELMPCGHCREKALAALRGRGGSGE